MRLHTKTVLLHAEALDLDERRELVQELGDGLPVVDRLALAVRWRVNAITREEVLAVARPWRPVTDTYDVVVPQHLTLPAFRRTWWQRMLGR